MENSPKLDIQEVHAVKLVYIPAVTVLTAYCASFCFNKTYYKVTRQWEAFVELNENLAAESFPKSPDVVHGYWFAAVNSNDTYLVTSRRRYLKSWLLLLSKYPEKLMKSQFWQKFILSEEKSSLKRFDDEDKCGYLTKEGHIVKNWKKRWFVLKNQDLYYFENKSAVKLKGVISLIDVNVASSTIKNISDYGISIIPKNPNENTKEFLLYAETKKSADSWIKILTYQTKMFSSKFSISQAGISLSKSSLLQNEKVPINNNRSTLPNSTSFYVGKRKSKDTSGGDLSSLMKRVPTPRPMQFNYSMPSKNNKDTTTDHNKNPTDDFNFTGGYVQFQDEPTSLEEIKSMLKNNLFIFFQDLEILKTSYLEIESKSPEAVSEILKIISDLTDLSVEILNTPVDDLNSVTFDKITNQIRKFYEGSGQTINRYVTRLLWIFTSYRRNIVSCRNNTGIGNSVQDLDAEREREIEFQLIGVADDQIGLQYLKEILKMATEDSSGVKRRDHVDGIGRTTYDCFLGSELVDWLIQGEKVAATREQGFEIGCEFIAMGEIQCVAQSQHLINRKNTNKAEKFYDSSNYYYRFTAEKKKKLEDSHSIDEKIEDFVLIDNLVVCRLCDREINHGDLMNHNVFCHMTAKCEATNRSCSRSFEKIIGKAKVLNNKGQIDIETFNYLEKICQLAEELTFEKAEEADYERIIDELKKKYDLEKSQIDDNPDIVKEIARQIKTLIYDKFVAHKTYKTASAHLNEYINEPEVPENPVNQSMWAYVKSLFGGTKTLPSTSLSNQSGSGSSLTSSNSKHVVQNVTMEDFDLIKIISSGGFGKIYLAQKKKTKDIYAIKSQYKTHLINKNVDIINEKNAMEQGANLPFVCNLYWAFQSREKVYLVMEYLPGGDLASLLQKFTFFNEQMTRQYIAEIVLILEYLHSVDIIHRDIKPHNFLISNTGHLKITDFGLAKIRNVGEVSFTDTTKKKSKKRVLGTPDYLSPEVLLGYEESFAVDWWALGVIGFELLTGIPPFSDDSVEKIFQHIVNREIYDWPDGLDDTPIVSENSKTFIDGLLQLDPVLRLGSSGTDKIKNHEWFQNYDWDKAFEAEIDSLLIPDTSASLVKAGDVYDAKEDAYISFSNAKLSQSTEIPNYSFVNLQSLKEKNNMVAELKK